MGLGRNQLTVFGQNEANLDDCSPAPCRRARCSALSAIRAIGLIFLGPMLRPNGKWTWAGHGEDFSGCDVWPAPPCGAGHLHLGPGERVDYSVLTDRDGLFSVLCMARHYDAGAGSIISKVRKSNAARTAQGITAGNTDRNAARQVTSAGLDHNRRALAPGRLLPSGCPDGAARFVLSFACLTFFIVAWVFRGPC